MYNERRDVAHAKTKSILTFLIAQTGKKFTYIYKHIYTLIHVTYMHVKKGHAYVIVKHKIKHALLIKLHTHMYTSK